MFKLKLVFLVCALSSFASNVSQAAEAAFGEVPISKLIVMPNAVGHVDWINAINSAKSSIHITMYHLTDASVITALKNKAQDKAVDLRILVDGKSLVGGYAKAMQSLKSAGVQIVGSSPLFNITHSKDMVVDGKLAFIGAIDLTNTTTTMRDFAIITSDAAAISEIESVFEADWNNAKNNTDDTPALSNSNLVWSPVNSDAQLLKLIHSATTTLIAETEYFNNPDITNAFNQAIARGVDVRLILPECAFGNWKMNYQGAAKLNGAIVHMEYDGQSIAQPYMHSKMMVVDGKVVYLGSVNSSFNSLNHDRELGIIFTDETTGKKLSAEFEQDWARSQVPAITPSCGSGR